jgi:hypothetical protein
MSVAIKNLLEGIPMKKAVFFLSALALLFATTAWAQLTASIKGNVTDTSGAAVVGAKIIVTNAAQGIERTTATGVGGDYEVPLLPPGSYTVKIEDKGFQSEQAEHVVIEAGQNVVQNFGLKVATATETVTVEGTVPIVETTTMTVGQTIDPKVVQEVPLNGRHFVDLALLVPGSVTPPQNGFLTAPLRGQGSFAVNTAGMREDAVNWMINGINLNDMVQNQVTFQPTINTVGEFKVDNSTYSADYGRNAGAIVTIASRSGTNQYHGELYDYVRNDFFDARNAFNPTTNSVTGAALPENLFIRNQFGGDFGGPIYKDKTFFFVTYEGERHRQGLATTADVFTNSQLATIAASNNPTVKALAALVPPANAGSAAVPVFDGSATAPVNIDQGTADITHNFNDTDRLHGYYVYQNDLRQEPTMGTNLPGFGDTRQGHRQVLTLGETHVFSSDVVNEGNIGFNRIHLTFTPNTTISPASLGLQTTLGPNELFMPTVDIIGGPEFGAERAFPQGRGDTTFVVNDNLSWIKGHHSFKFGGEFRDFRNDNFNDDPGQLIFNNFADFIAGDVDSTARTIGSVASRINVNALDFYAMDSYKWKPYFTFELGLRYGWNMTPSEADGRFVNFVPGGALGSMLVPTSSPYAQDDKDFQPRVGFAWDVFHNSKTVLRAGYAYQFDQPITGVVTGLTSNPPFATPLSFTFNNAAPNPPTTFASLPALFNGNPSSISPTFLSPNFTNADVQSWNLNIQQELTRRTSMMVGYFANKGTHLEDDINANQTTIFGKVGPGSANPLVSNTALPFQALSPNSPFLPGVGLASDIVEHESESNSTYNALWVTATQKTDHGLQFNASYTYSHSIDDVSRNLAGVGFMNSNDIGLDRASSDFDARQRFVANAIYDLPFRGNRLVSGWQVAPIVTLQSGNPYTITLSNSANINGVGGSVTPTVSGPVQVSGNALGLWIANPGVFEQPQPANTLGNLGRNAVLGPSFLNTDLSLAKNTKLTERLNLQVRADAFDLFNHPNYGDPSASLTVCPAGDTTAALCGTHGNQYSSFSTITSTRFPTGDYGSSRQLQLAVKLMF